ncbi:MAG TPA: FHA domain-containing protein [Anaerolineales bacterium]|nr:FHA domain-containing protein [Anaerolineales bacterium]
MAPLEVLALLRIALAVVLYGFFGTLLWLWWRSTRSPRTIAQRMAPARLVVIEPGTAGFSRGQTFPLGPVNALGRAVTADVACRDDGASLEHAMIHHREQRWWLEDLDSKNGTWLNQQRVEGASPLRGGDIIAIASIVFQFIEADGAEPDRQP